MGCGISSVADAAQPFMSIQAAVKHVLNHRINDILKLELNQTATSQLVIHGKVAHMTITCEAVGTSYRVCVQRGHLMYVHHATCHHQ